MGGVGKLVECGGGADGVGVEEGGDVGAQGLRVAGDVQDVGEAAGQFERGRVEAAARRVDEQGGEASVGRVSTRRSNVKFDFEPAGQDPPYDSKGP